MESIKVGPRQGLVRKRSGNYWSGKLIKYGILISFVLISITPVFWVFSTSLKTTHEVSVSPLGPPTSFRFGNYSEAWVQGRFGKYFGNSIIVSIPIVLGTIALACLAGYGLARFKLMGGPFIFYYFLLGLMVPFQSIMIPLFYTLRDIGFLGTYWAMIVPMIALGMPFGIFFMRAFFLGLPNDLADAGKIDGCNDFQVFRFVMLPLAGPGIATLAVFNFMNAWNAFLLPLIYMQKEELRTVVLGLMFYKSQYTQNIPLTMAGAAIVMLPIVVIYIIFQRKFIQGLTAGAVKG
jgi:ABC-type glycerol-3-phosphate transport system permease component